MPKWIGVENVVATVKELSKPLDIVDEEYNTAYGENSVFQTIEQNKMTPYKNKFEANTIYNDGAVTKNGQKIWKQ